MSIIKEIPSPVSQPARSVEVAYKAGAFLRIPASAAAAATLPPMSLQVATLQPDTAHALDTYGLNLLCHLQHCAFVLARQLCTYECHSCQPLQAL